METIKKINLKKNILIFLTYILLIVLFSYVYFKYHYFPWASDLEFHLSRIMELNSYKLFDQPFINTKTFGSVGTAPNVFYPSQLLYLMVFILKVIKSPLLAFYIFVGIINLITLLATDYAVFTITKSRFQSVLTAILFTFSFYRVDLLYRRFDLGEFLATMFIALTFAGFYHVVKNDKSQWQLVIGLTGLAYSHILSLAFTGIILIVLFIFTFIFNKQRLRILINCIVSAFWTILLSLGSLAPIISRTLSTHSGLQSTVFHINNVITATFNEQLLAMLKDESFVDHTIGGSLLVIGIICLVYVLMNIKSIPQIYLWTTLLFLFLFFMQTTYFPWKIFNNTPVTMIQFSFRINMYISLFIPFVFSYIMCQIKPEQIKLYVTTAFCGVVLFTSLNAIQGIIDNGSKLIDTGIPTSDNLTNDNFNLYTKANPKTHQNIVSDYFPKKADKYMRNDLSFSFGYINGQRQKIFGKPSLNRISYTVNTNSNNNEIDLPFIKYNDKDYLVTNNGKKISTNYSNRNTFLVKTHSKSNHIKIKYIPTFIDKYSFVISLISLFVYLAFKIAISFIHTNKKH